MIGRRAVLAGLQGVAALPVGHALAIEPYARPVVTRLTLPWAGPRLTIAMLSDIHAGEPGMSAARIEAIVAQANALAPDLIVLLGDYGLAQRVAGAPVPQEQVAATLARLRAPLGVLAVLGNHDWWEDPAARHTNDRRAVPRFARACAAVGLPVLRNAAVRRSGFWVAGLDSQWAFDVGRGAEDVGATLAAITDDAPALLLAHEPYIFHRGPSRFAVTLSGHTHGGQVRVLGHAPFATAALDRHYRHGAFTAAGRHLAVTAGLGTSFLPVRLGVPPEIMMVTLGG